MRDFGQWFAEQALPLAQEQPNAMSTEAQLADMGLDLMLDGSIWGECCVCKGAIKLTDYLTTDEILRDVDPENQYCGGSPRCCP